MFRKNAFIVMDTETSAHNGLVFDFGWTTIDKRGNVLGKGDLNFLDVLTREKPYYVHKIGNYARGQRKNLHKVTTFDVGRRLFNLHIQHLLSKNMRVILCAYNASFDCRVLGNTSRKMTGKPFLRHSVELADIWANWANSAPKSYNAPRTASGKFLSTSAENVYRFESQQPDFVEAHTAFADTEIESEILVRTLKRKKKFKIVRNPKDFETNIWEKFAVAFSDIARS
jgi:hypothetical protein